MAQQECIKVPFSFSAEDVRGRSKDNNLLAFIQSCYGMPWLTYLLENAINVESEKCLDAATFQYVVNFHFHLEPKKATYYRIKYAQ